MLKVDYSDCNTVEELYHTSMYQLAKLYTPDYPSYLPHIRELLKSCKTYRELGTNQGASVSSIILSKPEYIELVDINFKNYAPQQSIVESYAKEHSIEIVMHEQSSLTVNTDIKTEFLFVDSVHKYAHVKEEIKLYEPLTTKYIMFHDTVGFPGVGKAVTEFLESTTEWKLYFHLDSKTAGYTIIEKI